jgi:KDO2-lipid IV(A) lauroyltransferase
LKKAGSYIGVFFIRLSAWLPLWYLLFCASLMYPILYYILGYRRKVVRQNLVNTYPQKPLKDIIDIERRYYQHICDLVAENIWALRATEKQLQKHCTIKDIEVFKKLHHRQVNFICLLGHVGNWEWCSLAYNTYQLNPLIALYRPLKDEVFNSFFLRFRSRFGSALLPMQQLPRIIHAPFAEPTVLAFIADQSPVPEYAYWTQFLGRDTGFFNGYDKVARKKNYPVVLAYLKKIKRGYYEMHVELLADETQTLPADEITQRYVNKLESIIHENPAHWLWSHRRWKHKRPQ